MRDHDDFAELVAAVTPSLRRLALGLTADPHRAEDAVQATLERLFLAWPRVSVRDPAAYARTALVRQVASERRLAWWWREVSTGSPPERPDREGAGVEERLVLLEHLARLPERQRHTVVLRHLEDLSVAEVADLLGCTEGTVKRASYDGLRSLRASLEEAT